MKNLLAKLAIVAVIIGVSAIAVAGNNVHYAREGKTHVIDIARGSLNRLYIKGMRIHKIRAVRNTLVWKKDAKKGEFYVAPYNKFSNRPINFFLQDEAGNIYTVIARPKGIPSQSHQFVPRKVATKAAATWEKGGSYPKKIGEIIAHLYNHKIPTGYVSTRLARPTLLWKETDFVLVRRIAGAKFVGETYRLKNIDNKSMVLHEQEFVKNAKNRRLDVKGVAIDKHTLKPNESTFIHIVRTK